MLNSDTGQTENLTLTNHVLDITLPGGTGDLFKLGSGPFVGTTVPEPATMSLILGGSCLVMGRRRRSRSLHKTMHQ
ncbi:MAG TPA: PEP-CTERM sorting domain-containing protein [Tepidisphaeraceae bacterium]|jgi:hypothetical protein